ncbi:hypothetical protein Mal4_05340 [Maioricimonas rarisocia]|uniref:Uncharacterized protein n=1 Tax=Maioricimonas rarisocia TaxID=2528026 RepID=A0A517Z184_9PLAN|nr:hypothetical protein Mal4_05340 [Maioricimonas rarisocia]
MSERTGDDTSLDKYTLKVCPRETRQQVGRLTSHVAVAPVLVAGPVALLEAGPVTRVSEGGLQELPLRIRAVELDSGQELWSRSIRDTRYRGPFPP